MPGDLILYFLTVNYFSAHLVRRLLDSIENLSLNYRVIVVNNSPADRGIHNLQYDHLEIIEAGSNLGFGRACNLGLQLIYTRSIGATVWLINPDAYFLAEDLAKLPDALRIMQLSPIGGTLIYDEGGNVDFSGGKFDRFWGTIAVDRGLFASNLKSTDWVSGCSMVVNLNYFPECPLFDRDFFLYYEDFEFCRRYNSLGYPVMMCSQIKVIHATSSITSQMKDKLTQEIYSYLLALAKQPNKIGLIYRLMRIFLTSIGQIIKGDARGRAKLKGLKKFLAYAPLDIV